MRIKDFSGMAKRWPSEYVAREKIGAFTGGLIHPRTMANIDCQGNGPKGRLRFGNKIAYPLNELIDWLNNKIVIVDDNDIPVELKTGSSPTAFSGRKGGTL